MSIARPTKSEEGVKSGRPDLDGARELARELLAAPRALTSQVVQYLDTHHDVAEGEIAGWLRDTMPLLESYELDLILSPLFTPDFKTRVRFESVLGEGYLEADEIRQVIHDLTSGDAHMTLDYEGERIETLLPEVAVERFVRLLHLDAGFPAEASLTPALLDDESRCCLRDRAWQRDKSRELLPSLLGAARKIGTDFPAYVKFLTDFVRTHRPSSRDDCRIFLENLAQACEDDLRKHRSGSRPFFNEELKVTHAGKREVEEDVVAVHERTISMARALRAALPDPG